MKVTNKKNLPLVTNMKSYKNGKVFLTSDFVTEKNYYRNTKNGQLIKIDKFDKFQVDTYTIFGIIVGLIQMS